MSGISLTSSMRSNLLSLKNTSSLIDMTQNRLSTGNKVNSAIDNPSSYYTARSLNNRANDLSSLLDSMGQAVSTIKAATEAMESGLAFLEQAAAAAEQTITESTPPAGGFLLSIDELKAAGYKLIDSTMKADDIEALLVGGAKVALSEDITLDRGLNIVTDNVTIDGNGHRITYTASTAGESVINIDGAGVSVDIKNINISASGEQISGIKVTNNAELSIDNVKGFIISGTGAQRIYNQDINLFNGKANTEAYISASGVGANALAATACNQFYVGDSNGDFGQGKWYLPAIGELMNVYGFDVSQITSATGKSGVDAEHKNKDAINNALQILSDKGAEAEILANSYYWTSSENSNTHSWRINMDDGSRYTNYDDTAAYIRSFMQVENCFDPAREETDIPQIGDVMYADNSWGKATDYNSDKTAVGVITEVLADGSVKIMNLKNLTFSSENSTGNFDATNPYGGTNVKSFLTTNSVYRQDISEIVNYDNNTLLNALKATCNVEVAFSPSRGKINANFTTQYNAIVTQYDALLNDASYKGVNLLKNEGLKLRFDENGESILNISGKDMSSANLGMTVADWSNLTDVVTSINELKSAISSVRTFVTELGNNYSIVQTREDFTVNLINVLTEGADKLTLADMNEESANILALQTRQQLAINSLSLAAQSAQAVLKLF